jgi:lysyl endopeptidase
MKKYGTLIARHFLFRAMAVITMVLVSQPLQAQISYGGQPYSFANPVQPNLTPVVLSPVDVATLLKEDEAERRQGKHIPPRYGAPIEVDLGIDNNGTWEDLPNGDRLWRLKIISTGAYFINLIYDQFYMPSGAEFFVYDKDRSTVLGAFIAENNQEHGKFSTGPIKGGVVILEYYEPAFARGQGKLHISRVIHAYKDSFFKKDLLFKHDQNGKSMNVLCYGCSGTCNKNINCTEGQPWQNEKRAVAMILDNVGRWCSGALVNNKRQDLMPYFLSANHCYTQRRSDVYTWIFMFNYESSSCSNADGPTNQTVSGASLEANSSTSDFLLLKLYNTPPRAYNTYFAGWNATGTTPTSGTTIHHPSGDIKKISLDYDILSSNGSFWRVNDWDVGTTENGSSGAPLFNPDHQIIGQLFGGDAACGNNLHDDFGKFSVSWNNGLKAKLDPDNTGTTTLGGMTDPRPFPPTNVYITGSVGTNPRVNWTASSSPVSYYKVYRKGTYTAWSVIGTTIATNWVDSQITIQSQGGATDYYTYKVTAMGTNGWESESSNQPGTYGKPWCVPPCKAISQDNTEPDLPADYALYQNYPNPFNPNTVIHFSLPKSEIVSVKVYNIFGQEAAALINNQQYEAGHYSTEFNASGLASGVYFYRLQAGSFTATKKMLLAE